VTRCAATRPSWPGRAPCYHWAVTLATWLSFFAACWLISLSPGPGAISCMSAGLRLPYRTAAWNIAGLIAGLLTLVALVALGLGALLAASEVAFEVVRWLGAAYLVFLGVQAWVVAARPQQHWTSGPLAETPGPLFLRGWLVNVTNPKGIVFLLAVLPQFVDPARPTGPQYSLCAATLSITDAVVMSGYTLAAGAMMRWYRDEQRLRWLSRSFGLLFVAAGVALALWRRG
jgi:homoserine/homoserine lactone efflux protein